MDPPDGRTRHGVLTRRTRGPPEPIVGSAIPNGKALMLELISTVCAALAAWLWTPATTPSQRLARLLPRPTSYATSRSHPQAPLSPSTRSTGSPSTGSPSAGSLSTGSPSAGSPSASYLRTGSFGAGFHEAGLRGGGLNSDAPPSHIRLSTDDGQSRSIRPDSADPPLPTWLDEPPVRRLTSRTLIPATCTGLVVGLLIGGVAGVVAALLLAPVVAAILHKRDPPELQRDRRRIAADLPFAVDLMAACLLAGQPVTAATQASATAIAGPLGDRLSWVSAQLRLGADPEPTWAFLAREPAMAPLSRAMSRAAQSGAPVADVLTRLADDARDATRAASVAAARSVGVKAVAPLGLCFLPAFVLLGIIPVVAGLASAIVLP